MCTSILYDYSCPTPDREVLMLLCRNEVTWIRIGVQESKAKHITWSRPDKSRSFVILLDKCVINNRRIEIDIYRNIFIGTCTHQQCTTKNWTGEEWWSNTDCRWNGRGLGDAVGRKLIVEQWPHHHHRNSGRCSVISPPSGLMLVVFIWERARDIRWWFGCIAF